MINIDDFIKQFGSSAINISIEYFMTSKTIKRRKSDIYIQIMKGISEAKTRINSKCFDLKTKNCIATHMFNMCIKLYNEHEISLDEIDLRVECALFKIF